MISNEDVLTRHLLKLNKIEDQFRELTNRFEEINFKMDKLSSRITKIQSDTQIRFSDLENSEDQVKISKKIEKKTIYPVLTNRLKDFWKRLRIGRLMKKRVKN